MKHSSTRAVYAHWNERRGDRPAPERGDIDPAQIGRALSDTFMLAADYVEDQRFRLAGSRICALFGRELKGESFLALWRMADRKIVADMLAIVAEESLGAVAGLIARTADGNAAELELLLLPMVHKGHARLRSLGVLAPIAVPYWLGTCPATELELGALRHIGPELERVDSPRLQPAPEGSRVRHGLVVYDGGRGRGDASGASG